MSESEYESTNTFKENEEVAKDKPGEQIVLH